LSIEGSADGEAAGRPGDREAICSALLKTTATILGPVPAFTAAFTLLARLEALAMPPADPSLRRRIGGFARWPACLRHRGGLLGCSVLTDHGSLHLVGDCPIGAHAGE
jgi:hypothetical protein